VEEDDDVRVAILQAVYTPGRPVFCAGHDLQHFLSHLGTAEEHRVSTARGGFAGFVQRKRSKPVVAAVDGLATAGGFEMVLACDIVIGTPRAAFALPEVRWNLMASGGGVFLAPRMLGIKVAADMMLTGQELTGQRAFDLGLMSRIVASDALADEAMAVAAAICRNAPRAISLTRETMEQSESLDRTSSWALALAGESELRTSDDLREGLSSFVERRAANWTGR
jgi:enoyl-CoA hydratase